MRQVGGDTQPRPRKRSSDLGPSTVIAANPTSFILGTEQEVDARLDAADRTRDGNTVDMAGDGRDSEYGVRSIEDVDMTAPVAPGAQPDKNESSQIRRPEIPRRRSTIRATNTFRDHSLGQLSAASGLSSEASSPSREDSQPIPELSESQISQPLTPLSRASPGPCTGAGSPRSISAHSLRHPDEEYEAASQAVFSSSDEDSNRENSTNGHGSGPSGLQLVMPSLTLPSRRPFTERGKQLGKLKLLFAGASGSGKTSLIKSFVQTCDDIVHIDPLSPNTSEADSRRNTKARVAARSTKKIAEIAASTKPYPHWWSEVEESQILRRRKSSGEEVLERNVCFIDTPGYDNGSSMLGGMEVVLQYIETQMKLTISTSAMHDNDLLGVLGGSGGMQVDAVLYLLPTIPKPIDLEFLRQLSKLTNVIPLLSKIDLVQEDAKEHLRSHIAGQIRSADLPLLSFPEGFPQILDVCSSPSNDLESMDASLLMASDFVQPLHDSDLPVLIDYLLDASNSTFMKHLAAKKLVEWRKTPSTRSFALTPSPLRTNLFSPTLPISSNASSSGRRVSAAPLSPTSAALTYTSARLTDHKQREERLAQINLGNWAEGIRRSLAAERARYESIASAEREKWLRERLQECVFDSRIANDDNTYATGPRRNQFSDMCVGLTRAQNRPRTGRHDALDPFALMYWRRQALTAMQVVGGFSVLGAIALWATRTWELDWQWLDDYGLSRLQALFGGQQTAFGAVGGGQVGRMTSDW